MKLPYPLFLFALFGALQVSGAVVAPTAKKLNVLLIAVDDLRDTLGCPTVADLCGLTPPPNLAGQSLRALLRDPASPGKPAAFTLVTRGNSRGDSIRTDRWRFTRWSDGAVELYDHAGDPEEDRNIAASHPDIVRDLSHQLSAALAALSVPQRQGVGGDPEGAAATAPSAGAKKNGKAKKK